MPDLILAEVFKHFVILLSKLFKLFLQDLDQVHNLIFEVFKAS